MKKILFSISFFLFSLKMIGSAILIPMDAESQKNHLKAYGITYWILAKQQKVQWLLNYRGGSFLLPDGGDIRKECQIRGVSFEVLSDSEANTILDGIASPSQNQEAVILEKAPKIAVYTPKGLQPWDDAVTMVLTYAEIPYETI
ncbi:MAG: asparagine synthetase B, partial [Cellulophaga sp.]|nr:asparagine synthetase B [Cellulophaga sp.]